MDAHTNSFITLDEWLTLGLDEKLDQKAMAYQGVSHTQLSIARHCGGITVNDQHYTYFPATDELIRDDVLQAVTTLRKQKAALERVAADAQQLGLGY
jgi:DNA integrity scanning protein DisA with diadenylate cyclase activity